MTVGIIGLGLMGGSLAKAITFGTEHTVWGTNRSPEPVKKALFAGAIQKELKKEDLFPYVSSYGALPRKTFSMGEGVEKRYYLEAKRITRN